MPGPSDHLWKKTGVSPKIFFLLRRSARQQGKLLDNVQFALFMAAYLLAEHHIFMLALAGLACPH